MMAEPGPVTDSRETTRADGVEVLFMQGESCAAKGAFPIILSPDTAAGGTPHHGGLVGSTHRYRHQFAAQTMKQVTR